ncbi:hypothetical protein J4234_03795 [Candidatus Woesearchaeota archaeon]|nr:hypothetical protein [Candidatus Woesearchaeota archaeon]
MDESIRVVVAKDEGYFGNLKPNYSFRVINELGTGGGFGYNSPEEVGEILKRLSELNSKKPVQFVPFKKEDLGIFVCLPSPKPLDGNEMAEVKKTLSGQ